MLFNSIKNGSPQASRFGLGSNSGINLILIKLTIKIFTLILILITASFSWGTTAAFSQGPENTLVVVNTDSADSLAIANHYIELRDIPPVNVVYVSDIITHQK